MSRLLAVLTLLAGVALGGVLLPVFVPTRNGLRAPAVVSRPADLDGLSPWRGASRDRTLPGKARRRARRASRT